MRKTKFRGLTSGSGKWVIGDLIHLDNDTLIAGKDMCAGKFIDGHIELQAVSVYPESIGEFTGLKDNKGKEIYEGDIILYPVVDKPDLQPYCIQYKNGAIVGCLTGHNGEMNIFLCKFDFKLVRISGNIHENPELLQ